MINNEGVSIMAGVPTVWLGIYNHVKSTGGSLPTVKKALVGGSALPESLLRAYELELGIPMQQGWGMTETSPLGTTYSAMPDYDYPDYDSTVKHKLYAGRRIFGVDMRIVDDEGNVLPQDGEAEGHLHVRGPWVSSGYFKGAGSDSFTDDGWFATGDVAHRDGDGFYWFDDRLKHVVISGGENIYPAEIERVLRNVPGVDEVAVVGRADARWGQVPVAAVVGTVEKSIIMDACESLARFKRPADVVFVDALPRNALGKVLVQQLSDSLA